MPKSNEPDRCIRLEIPGEGHFDITKDVAIAWYNQLGQQLHKDDLREFDEDDELPLDEENPTPLVGMD